MTHRLPSTTLKRPSLWKCQPGFGSGCAGWTALLWVVVTPLAAQSPFGSSRLPVVDAKRSPPEVHRFVTTVAEDRTQVRIAELIEQLADANYHRRQAAKWELARIGLAAFEQLRQAAQQHPNAEIALSARYIIDSQNVVWWLETDSLEVRELLKTYNEAGTDDRDTLMQQLAELKTPDALLALCRLSRFESHELRSKSAALYLMSTIAELLADTRQQPIITQSPSSSLNGSAPGNSPGQSRSLWITSIELTMGDSRRTSAQWLQRFVADLRALESGPAGANLSGENLPAEKLPAVHLAPWQQLIAAEHRLAVEQLSQPAADTVPAKRGGLEFSHQLDRFRSVAVTLRFYRWLGTWITQHHGRSQALDMVRPSLKLVGFDQHALQAASEWVLEADLPELVVELSQEFTAQFSAIPELGYFLAEAYLQLQQDEQSQLAANNASDSILTLLNTNLRNFQNLDLREIQANRHYQLADTLSDRGLFAWAEQEYRRALSIESRIEPQIRIDFAQFFWDGGKHAEAAEVLKPLAGEALNNQELELPAAPHEFRNPALLLANFYFYSGLAALDRGDKESASDFLQKSLEAEESFPNPDAVIAMQRLGSEEPFSSYFQRHFDKMTRSFRIRVIQAEEQLARSVDRRSRAVAAPNLAAECNQLAWLLGKCGVHPEEAINLSLRSLELKPDEPTYLDTLARCYFAAGQIENAVRTQRQAVQLAPHERQLAAQLKEFEAALAP